MFLRHTRMIALLCVSAVVNVVLITYLLNEKYKASTLVLITPQLQVDFVHPTSEKELLSFPVSSVGVSTQTETSTKTYSELIMSRPVIERVVRALRLDQPDSVADGSRMRRLEDGVKDLLADMAQTVKYGRILQSSAFDKAASELATRVSVNPTRNSYVFTIDCIWPNAQRAADVANETARAFVDLLSEISKNEALGARQFIERRLHDSEADLVEARSALQKFKEQHRSIAFEEETAQRIRLVAKLEGMLETTQSRLSGLLHQLTPDNPKVVNLQAQRDRLAESVAQRKREMTTLPDTEAQLATLLLNVKTAEQLYQLITREYEEARIREAKGTSDIRVVAPALIPVLPVQPIKIYYAAVALVMALMLGVGFALAFEVTNTTLRSIDAVQGALDIPVLATVPDLDAFKDRAQ